MRAWPSASSRAAETRFWWRRPTPSSDAHGGDGLGPGGPRAVPIDGPVGHELTRQLQGVSLTAMRTRHGSSETPPNVMYLVEPMDGDFPRGRFAGRRRGYPRFGLGSAPVDLALVHFWFPFEPNCARFLEDVLRPDHVALTHLPIDREGDIP